MSKQKLSTLFIALCRTIMSCNEVNGAKTAVMVMLSSVRSLHSFNAHELYTLVANATDANWNEISGVFSTLGAHIEQLAGRLGMSKLQLTALVTSVCAELVTTLPTPLSGKRTLL